MGFAPGALRLSEFNANQKHGGDLMQTLEIFCRGFVVQTGDFHSGQTSQSDLGNGLCCREGKWWELSVSLAATGRKKSEDW